MVDNIDLCSPFYRINPKKVKPMCYEKIRELRIENNLTQDKAAKVFNVSPRAVTLWESGKRTPDIFTLQKISEFYNVSIDWLAGNSDDRQIIDIDIEDRYIDFAEQAQRDNINPDDIIRAIGIIKKVRERNKK